MSEQYRFTNINPTGEAWVWRKQSGTTLEVCLRPPTTDETLFLAQPLDYRKGTAEIRRYIADRMFKDFRGAEDAKGETIPNTVAMRAAMLDNPGIYAWISSELVKLGELRAEGNGDSGSA